jgi:hypothetical protein
MAVRCTKNSKSPFKNPVNNFNKILDGITQNSPLVPCPGRQKVDLSQDQSPRSTIRCRNELGGMLNYYYREAA